MKKRLLEESDTRRFMKLANIDVLTENFMDGTIAEMEHEDAEDNEDEVVDPMDDEPMADVEEPMADEPELDVADEEPAAQVDLDASEAEALLSAIGDAVSEVTGLDVTVSGDAEEEMPEEPMEAPMDAPLEEDELAAADISLEETTETETAPTLSEEDFVNEVTRRVAERLIKLANQ
jgi:hypothetical protein